ncbi:L-lactate dehydrogenase complex protein LldG [Nocardiopsis mwathae]|uniref:L-lactate dehydrogenase complex protein LldG n=1 Tax=Nocardiopsis mwathae TaxID=1472723 RepID=A0A7X0D599_9ACTN|nr:LUD domain-containing protein [Nocardiopsis mwathae]MBB6172008.1 L-lactate dehydrogenase complex protein LldG [Nocardiopsis mwathae]
MSGSRERILARVRAALADVPAGERPADVEVPRIDARPAGRGGLDVLVDRLSDYRALVHRVAPEELPGAVAAALRRRGARRVVVPSDLPPRWTGAWADTDSGGTSPAGARVLRDAGTGIAALDAVDGVVTGCAVAIAETGTIVLDCGEAQGRRALTLVPDYHLCVVRADQVVDDVPRAVSLLDPRRPLTWISGPSATSDIELDRVEGVHGPRTLEVLIVG